MPIREIVRSTGLSRNTISIYIDLFKPINDQYEHAEGDEALKAFSNILRENFRDTDVIWTNWWG
jgi:diguanylate cyclase (GGDEF)-like protein